MRIVLRFVCMLEWVVQWKAPLTQWSQTPTLYFTDPFVYQCYYELFDSKLTATQYPIADTILTSLCIGLFLFYQFVVSCSFVNSWTIFWCFWSNFWFGAFNPFAIFSYDAKLILKRISSSCSKSEWRFSFPIHKIWLKLVIVAFLPILFDIIFSFHMPHGLVQVLQPLISSNGLDIVVGMNRVILHSGWWFKMQSKYLVPLDFLSRCKFIYVIKNKVRCFQKKTTRRQLKELQVIFDRGKRSSMHLISPIFAWIFAWIVSCQLRYFLDKRWKFSFWWIVIAK